jgi:hypothetical protein
MLSLAMSSRKRPGGSPGSWLKGTVGFTAVLIGFTSCLSPAASAQTSPADTERLNAEMQNAATGRSAPPAAPNTNCTLLVPKDPLSAAGLATPYQLTATDPGMGPCSESNSAQSAFVQAAILDPATGSISIYNPLVIDKGGSPLVPPVVPTLPAGAIVAIWFGFNGIDLTLSAESAGGLTAAQCVNGSNGNVFGQFAYCNAPAFFAAANAAITAGKLQVPALGTASDGKPCPTVRDFFVVDQDQSDNLPTLYLVSPQGHMSQFTRKNQAAHPTSKPLGNPSDNRLTDAFVDPAMGCKPWTAPDLADPGSMVSGLALNELQARFTQPAPVALVPGGDPMTLVNGNQSLTKTNLYRRGVDMPTADSYSDIDTARYCRQLLRTAPQRMLANQKALEAFATPDAGAANSLFTFLAQRFVATYQLLDCAALVNESDPISITVNGQGAAVGAAVNTAALDRIVKKLSPQKADDDAADSIERERRATP